MLRSKDLKGKLVRWALKLQEYDYSVHYRPGAQNVVPDALSRAVVGSVDYDKNVCFHPDCKGDPSKTVNWIQCDGCDKWFHLICLGFSLKEVNYLDEYFCINCSPSMTSSKQTVHKVESSLPDMNRFLSEQNWVERVNRNLVSMLCCFVAPDHANWDKYISEFMFALNSFKYDATKFSPSKLFLGQDIKGPGEWMEMLQDVGGVAHKDMLAAAGKNMGKQREHNKVPFDKRRSKVKVTINDRVLLKSHPLSNLKRNFSAKLAPKWRVPFIVKAQLSPVNFVIESEEGSDKRIAHVEQLKLIL
ncbi:Lysine-specific demethylase lid [Holothuria leucospilota]|uniref:Lysine-specific demethylase lid n=1 Tax=Holothuria leucospilota TaxID=206669 RepID=A0A9Q0YC11_HOLLE|nr:Lysine-specific demethylase lid [Holothuria leucospilota]